MSQSSHQKLQVSNYAAPVLAATNDPALKRILERIDTLGLTSNLIRTQATGLYDSKICPLSRSNQ